MRARHIAKRHTWHGRLFAALASLLVAGIVIALVSLSHATRDDAYAGFVGSVVEAGTVGTARVEDGAPSVVERHDRVPDVFIDEVMSVDGTSQVAVAGEAAVVGLVFPADVDTTDRKVRHRLLSNGWVAIPTEGPLSAYRKDTGTFRIAYVSLTGIGDETSVTLMMG